jgi:hypothetical protein
MTNLVQIPNLNLKSGRERLVSRHSQVKADKLSRGPKGVLNTVVIAGAGGGEGGQKCRRGAAKVQLGRLQCQQKVEFHRRGSDIWADLPTQTACAWQILYCLLGPVRGRRPGMKFTQIDKSTHSCSLFEPAILFVMVPRPWASTQSPSNVSFA